MRYVNKRHRKKDNREGRSFFAISVIVCGMLIYALYVSSAGKWIMKNYIEPVFLENKDADTKQSEVTEQKGGDSQNNSGNTGGNTEQRTMSYEGFTMYSMQVGAFSAKENADQAAKEIKSRGGAGYVLHDGMYRVLAFGYSSEGEANTVKDQLKTAASMESSVYAVTVPRLDFKVTGEEKNLQAVDSAFKTYLSSKDKMGQLAINLDKNEITKEQAINELDAIKKELSNAVGGIDKLSKSDEKLGKFHSVCKDIIALFEEMTDSDMTVFSANVKNIYMEMVCRYSAYVKEVSAG